MTTMSDSSLELSAGLLPEGLATEAASNMRVAVQGCGYWGSKHVRVLDGLEGVDQVIAVDFDPHRLEAMESSFPRADTARKLEEVLDEVDAVIVATPPETHADLAAAVMSAGKHVLVEKPMATSVAGAERMVELAAAHDVVLAVGHTFEFNAAVWELRKLIVTGELGRPLYIDTARLNLGLYQHRTNVIWDLAPHDISIINYVLRDQPTSVEAWGSTHLHHRLEDVGYLWLDYGRLDVQAHIHVSWLDPSKVRRVTVVGDKKMAVYNDLASEERIRVYDKGLDAVPQPDSPEMPLSYRVGPIVSPHIPFTEPLRQMDADFIQAVEKGTSPATDGLNGLGVVRVLEAADLSLREGRKVDMDEVARYQSASADR